MDSHSASDSRSVDPTILDQHSLFAGGQFVELPDGFPFRTTLSLELVIEQWRRICTERPEIYAAEWRELQKTLDAHPHLSGPIGEAELEAHEAFVHRLLRPVFPSHSWMPDARAITGPFGGDLLMSTQKYAQVFANEVVPGRLKKLPIADPFIQTLYAYRAILAKFYNVSLNIDQPLVFVVPEPTTGLFEYYKLNAPTNFIAVKAIGTPPRLTDNDKDELFQNVSDLTIWTRKLPPELFEFVGVTVLTMTRVTDETATASITHAVLTSDANITEDNFDEIEREVRNLFRLGDLRMGLASRQRDGLLNFASDRRIWNSLVIRDAVREGNLDWHGTIYLSANGYLSRKAERFDVGDLPGVSGLKMMRVRVDGA